MPCNTIDELNCETSRCFQGYESRIEQLIAGTQTANDILADDVSNYQNMYGIWGLLPSHTHEIPEGELMLSAMKKNRIFGWRLIPNIGRYLIKDFVLKDWFKLAIDRKIPIFINTAHGTGLVYSRYNEAISI